MKFYITKANFNRITRKYDFSNISVDVNAIINEQIYFFNQYEINRITSVLKFLHYANNENLLFEFCGTGFREDTFSFVHETPHHAKYHQYKSCDSFNSNYEDVQIPLEIKYKKGSSEIDVKRVEQFRNWFKQPEIELLYKTDQKKFVERLQLKFQLIDAPPIVKLNPTGAQEIHNLSENDLQVQINLLARESESFMKKNRKNQIILWECGFSNMTYLATSPNFKNRPIIDNYTEFSDEEIRELLLEFYYLYKLPMRNLLVDYWIVKLNPKLEFSQNILEQMGFKLCSNCLNTKIIQQNILNNLSDNEIIDELPF